MEYAIDQSLKIYSGGLGILAGSHLRSAHELNQSMIAVGLLYKNGYYDQESDENGYMEVTYVNREYSFLENTGIEFTITIHNAPVKVRAYSLSSDVFRTDPLYLLSTDFPENDELSRSITHRLYDSNETTRIAQSMLLGIGGAKLLEHLNYAPDVYHLNEGHGLPLVFYLYEKYRDLDEVKKRLVFTSHTSEAAGNDLKPIPLLKEMNFFGELTEEEINKVAKLTNGNLDFTLTALCNAKVSNAVSKIHKEVMQQMWKPKEICPLISITNAQKASYWTDSVLKEMLKAGNNNGLLSRKRELKRQLLQLVASEAGKLFDPEILTIVWARRFAGYKRADLLLKEHDKLLELITRAKNPIQIIWAGKPYPEDKEGIAVFNNIVAFTKPLKRCAVLMGYELQLSIILKRGADVWLNTPRLGQEASGTSGMTAAMNGCVNLSMADGWFPEFVKEGYNGFVIPGKKTGTEEEKDEADTQALFNVLEKEIIPLYYHDRARWIDIMKNAMTDIVPAFDSDRMAKEYYEKMYSLEVLSPVSQE